MKLGYFIFAVFVIGPACAQWEEFIGQVATKVMGLWKDEQVEFLGHRCDYSMSPGFYRWQLYYKTKVMCPGWTTIIGRAKTKSPSGSLEHATKDFVNKALKAGLVTEEQVKEFIRA
ncbi:unnamed protein product [Darwinula stevensoni]|uniref:Anti-lipopolysaccharide factor n=1 Tax=Darwinula stevensoni TaxID=69355 RepID=A0A7R9AAZ4_9CRUS|nr:unnamed protein product [Darwinula stevensoni]CAG0898607.1 unnamed protein product [Darwinula stevensoni]